MLNRELAAFIDPVRFSNFQTVRALIDRGEIRPDEDIKSWVQMEAILASVVTKINTEGQSYNQYNLTI